MPASSTPQPKVEEFVLAEDCELRFDVASEEVIVEVIEGQAEAFGTELVMNKRYSFPEGARAAVFTWHGCKVELVGTTEGAYIAKHTPMVIYVNTHAALEQMRQQSAKDGTRGPRIMIAGPMDVGKSTVCRILLNYAARVGRSPIFVDIDVGQGSITVPGTIGALFIERPADPVEGFDKRAPLVYHFGHLSPGENMPLYTLLVSTLASSINRKTAKSVQANVGGVVINTCGWVKGGEGYACLVSAAEAFEIDVVVVIDHERLYNELQKDLPTFVKIVHQPKSGGVEERSRQQRINSRKNRIKTYFYGTKRNPFYPHSFEIGFADVSIYKIGAPSLPDSCMPLGMKPEDTRTRLVSIQPNKELQHRLLGVSMSEVADQTVLTTNVAGFVCVTDVNIERQTLTLLSPQPYPLPRNILLWSEITYLDSMT